MPATPTGLNEECGVFGVWNAQEAAQLTYLGLHSLQHRGQEAAGIVSFDTEAYRFHQHLGLGLLSRVFQKASHLAHLSGDFALGHVRYATAGNNLMNNVQPFVFTFYDMQIAFAHNGNIVNAGSLRRTLESRGAVFRSTSDTEILIHLIRHSPQLTFNERLEEALRQLRGGFSFVLLKETTLYAAVDQHALRPLVVGKMEDGGYVVASETCALDAVGARFVYSMKPGEYLQIDEQGMRVFRYAHEEPIAVAAMECVYFARPDSEICGVTVHTARKRSGRRLAEEAPVPDDCIVVGVPNSSLSAASGFAEASGLPYEMGLIKNQYVARTFIQPTQDLRERAVRMKLSAVRGVVAGKKVALIDDSIVRGTTSRRIVRLLRDAGAAEVHVRIASPVFAFPSFYGIDVSTTAELIGAHRTVPEICEYIGADSLAYLSVTGLVEAIGLPFDAPYGGLCMESFTGYYPIPLYDYEAELRDHYTPVQAAIQRECAERFGWSSYDAAAALAGAHSEEE